MGINLGATISPIVCGYVAQRISFRLAFIFAVVGMSCGVLQFVLGKHRLQGAGEKQAKAVAGPSGKVAPSITPADWPKLGAIGILFCFSAIFWGAFEQAGSSLNLFARDLTLNSIFGWEFPSSWLQSLNAFFIVAFAPVFSWIWMKLGKNQPSSPAKFAFGLMFGGIGFMIVAYAASISGGAKVSALWLVFVYLFHTFGELSLSPVGMSTFSALAPARIVGLMMGVWYLSISAGNLIAGLAARSFDATNLNAIVNLFGTVAAICIGSGVVLFALTPYIKKLMGGVR